MTCQDSFHEVAFKISFWTRNISSARILFLPTVSFIMFKKILKEISSIDFNVFDIFSMSLYRRHFHNMHQKLHKIFCTLHKYLVKVSSKSDYFCSRCCETHADRTQKYVESHQGGLIHLSTENVTVYLHTILRKVTSKPLYSRQQNYSNTCDNS